MQLYGSDDRLTMARCGANCASFTLFSFLHFGRIDAPILAMLANVFQLVLQSTHRESLMNSFRKDDPMEILWCPTLSDVDARFVAVVDYQVHQGVLVEIFKVDRYCAAGSFSKRPDDGWQGVSFAGIPASLGIGVRSVIHLGG